MGNASTDSCRRSRPNGQGLTALSVRLLEDSRRSVDFHISGSVADDLSRPSICGTGPPSILSGSSARRR